MISNVSLAKPAEYLKIFFIDVEGGQSTLVVSPAKRSLLIDAGWAGGRDAGRIAAAMKAAGIEKIDYLLITHFHRDHVGGVPDLLEKVKVGTVVDHGPDIEDSDAAKQTYAAYRKAIARAAHITLKPGEGLPFKDIRVQTLAAAGAHISEPLPGAGEGNRYCASEKEPPADDTENSQSLGVLITYGKFRFLDLGDLPAGKSLELVCPNNLIGQVDLYLTTHHGGDPDNPKALVWAVHPWVAVMNNGDHKGGSPEAWQIVHDSPGLEDLWQLHDSVVGGKEHNSDEKFVANVDEASDGHFIQVTAASVGNFTMTNSRNSFEKKYTKNPGSGN